MRYRLSLMTLLEQEGEENVHQVLSGVLVDAALEAIDRMSDVRTA